jgi:hypothetical protein
MVPLKMAVEASETAHAISRAYIAVMKEIKLLERIR